MAKSKMHGVTTAMDFKPKSGMTLEGKHAALTADHKVGQRVKFVVTAIKNRHSMGSAGDHSSAYEINGLALHQDDKQYSGPDKKASNNDAKD